MVLKKIGKNWALVSKTDNSKVLRWFGPVMPSREQVLHEERRVQYFKNMKKRIKVRGHMRKGRPISRHIRRTR